MSVSHHNCTKTTMVASAVFITDLQGKSIISRNYRGDVPLNKAIDQFQTYLTEVEDEAKKPVFHVDTNGEISVGEDVGANGIGGEHFVYVAVSTISTEELNLFFQLTKQQMKRPQLTTHHVLSMNLFFFF